MFIKTNLLRFYNISGRKWVSCLAVVLLLLSMFPASALGATGAVKIYDSGTIDPLSMNASDISAKGFSIDLTLTGNEWNESILIKDADGNLTGDIDPTLYPDLTECFTTTAGAIQLETLLDTATFTMLKDTDEKYTTIKMEIKKQPYNIKVNQSITFTPPKAMLMKMVDVTPDTFSVNADYAKISGSLTSGATESNINSGRRELIIELNNCLWNTDLTSTTGPAIKALFEDSGFSAGTEDAEWKKVREALKGVDSIAVSPDEKKLTITLPVVPTYNITTPQTLTWNNIDKSLIKGIDSGSYSAPLVNIENNSFTIAPVSQSATLSGTVITATEPDIIAGGKTLVITLKNDIWAQTINGTDVVKWFKKEDGTDQFLPPVVVTDVIRSSNTVLSITLPPTPFDAGGLDQTIKVNIPDGALVSNKSIDAGSFPVKAVTVTLSGTAVNATSLTGSSVIAGGKTIIITLKDATWKADVITNNLKDLLDCFTPTPSGSNWEKIETKIEEKNITLSGKNVLTIKLPPTANYKETGQSEVVGFKLKPGLLNESLSSTRIASEKLNIGETAVKANIGSIPTTVPEVVKGGQVITVTLFDGSWDSSLPTNKSKISSLVSGFSADSDSASWALVQTALKNAGIVDNLFVLTDDNKKLTITLPPVPGYDPVKIQKISLTIPKAVLLKATSNVWVDGSIQISLPGLNSKGKLQDMLGEGMVALIKDVSLQKIYLSVPTKYITSVVSKQSVIKDNTTVNSLDIITDSSVTSVNVKVTVKEIVKETGDEAIVNETNYSSNVPLEIYGNVKKFNVGFATQNSATTSETYSEAEISVLGTATPQSVTIKIGGSKTYKYTDLSGSYSLYKLMNNSSLLNKILDNYALTDIIVQTI